MLVSDQVLKFVVPPFNEVAKRSKRSELITDAAAYFQEPRVISKFSAIIADSVDTEYFFAI